MILLQQGYAHFNRNIIFNYSKANVTILFAEKISALADVPYELMCVMDSSLALLTCSLQIEQYVEVSTYAEFFSYSTSH